MRKKLAVALLAGYESDGQPLTTPRLTADACRSRQCHERQRGTKDSLGLIEVEASLVVIQYAEPAGDSEAGPRARKAKITLEFVQELVLSESEKRPGAIGAVAWRGGRMWVQPFQGRRERLITQKIRDSACGSFFSRMPCSCFGGVMCYCWLLQKELVPPMMMLPWWGVT